MSSNNNLANGPAGVQPNSDVNPIDKMWTLVTESAHYVLRLYFSILLLVYVWFVRIAARILQPLDPIIQNVYKIPKEEVTAEGIRQQLSRLVYTILLFLSPLVNRVIVFATRPLVWARDKVADYVEQGEKQASKQTKPKSS